MLMSHSIDLTSYTFNLHWLRLNFQAFANGRKHFYALTIIALLMTPMSCQLQLIKVIQSTNSPAKFFACQNYTSLMLIESSSILILVGFRSEKSLQRLNKFARYNELNIENENRKMPLGSNLTSTW